VGIPYFRLGAVVCLSLASAACTQTDFPASKAQNIMAAAPIHLDAEQVGVTGSQVDCGAQNDLWEPPGPVMGQHSTAHLLSAGKALNFDDDVIYAEPGYHTPYVQVRGDFMMQLADVSSIRDEGADSKLVEGRLMVVIPHACFSDPLPLLGVRKGKFSEDAVPVMEFHLLQDGWHFTKLVH
jgi:hypothetical protein